MLKSDYYICPECGAEVRVGSKGCSRCASERATKHWEQDEIYDGLDLPDEEFNYEEFVNNELRDQRETPPYRRWWWWVGLALLAAWVVLALGMRAWPSWLW